MQVQLLDRIEETNDVTTFVWKSDTPVSWRAGQFMRYTIPHEADDRGISRWFTIAAPPYELHPRITTRFSEPGSSFKSALKELPIGSTIQASGPSGDFVVDDSSRPFVLIAGGIGITPFRAILLQLDHDNVEIHGHLLYANRTDEYPFSTELAAIAKKQAACTVSYFSGNQHITRQDILQAAQTFSHPLFYISGPEPMVQSYKDILMASHISEGEIKTDFFPGYKE